MFSNDNLQQNVSYKQKRSNKIGCYDQNNQKTNKKPLLIGVLLPESYKRRIRPSLELALLHVDLMEKILPDYCLRPIYKDTQVRFKN